MPDMLIPLAFIALVLLIYAFFTVGRPPRVRESRPVRPVSWWTRISPLIFLFLAFLTATVGLLRVNYTDRHLGLRRIPRHLERNRIQMKVIADHLRSYSHLHGHYPTNDEGLAPIKHLLKNDYRQNLRWNRHYPSTGDFPLTVWGEPFIYENRRGINASNFLASGATRDQKRIYSIQVDNDIYVWSLGARKAQLTYDVCNPKLHSTTMKCVALALFFVFCYLATTVWVVVKVGKSGENMSLFAFVCWAVIRDGLLGIFTAAICLPLIAGPTCYEGSWVLRRTPELTKDYFGLVQKYHDRGIIGDEAYKKIKEAIKDDVL